ncbi:MAG: CapA family protein [Bacteroidales bacterium]|nr:CapA family protein [Bacteroidales bacterium]
MMRLLILMLLVYQFSVQHALSQTDSLYLTSKLKIVFAGDIMGHDSQISGAFVDSTNSYDYEPVFRHIADYIASADIAVGNLEVTLAGKPYKGYPQFSSPDELALAARNAGFGIFLTANNHSLDRGAKGLVRTIKVLDSLNVLRTGTFISQLERDSVYPLILERNNIKLAILNYTYGTNGITVDTPFIVNRIDTSLIRLDLEKTKSLKPDFTIVAIHWGNEYERNENKVQQKLAEFIFKNGADAIIGSHPHVVQPIKYIEVNIGDSVVKRPVFYSLGNFVSNQRAQYKDGGIMAELHISKNNNTTTLDSAAYLPYWVYRNDTLNKQIFYVVPVAKYKTGNTGLNFNSDNEFRFNRFTNDTRELLKNESVPESGFYINTETKQ